MRTVTTPAQMKDEARRARSKGQRIGLVPTMGALHKGHLSLVARARSECDLVVLSIFVNRLQFGPTEDFTKYPRDLDRDTGCARTAGVGILFVPSDDAIHPAGHRTLVRVSGMQDVLCGRTRPGHFEAVATVVAKLFSIVRPDSAYFGEKDAQQLRIIRRMARDLHDEVEVVGCPTVRDRDGLALSSRNSYLTHAERRAAPVLYRALREVPERVRAGETDAASLVRSVREVIASRPEAEIEYVEAVDDETLEPVIAINRPTLVATAVRFGRARLIDNIVVGG